MLKISKIISFKSKKYCEKKKKLIFRNSPCVENGQGTTVVGFPIFKNNVHLLCIRVVLKYST
jgi:hypothetical protein